MQPDKQSNYWQPGDQPQPVAPPAAPPVPRAATPFPATPPAPALQPVTPQPAAAPVQPPQPLSPPSSVSVPAVAVAPAIPPQVVEEPEQAELDEDYDDDPQADNAQLAQPVNWQAKEYIHQEKNATWFVAFAVVLVGLMAVAILLMKSWSFAVLLVVIAVVIIVFAKRPPRTMSYTLSEKGLHIGDTLHAFSDFKAFGVIRDGEEYSVMLIPTKRFQPGVTVYFPEDSGEQIVDMLGTRLPMQDLHLDIIDRFVRKLRL